ncbi:MAG: putative ATP-dependent RNA helicase exp9 [uncultured bacterium (gcode 4)]|uniref:Putative ATP-dependent RNA helicase exp9 n=1 Tax=uncultured bacterium (gcode 4) TaxID=1234023 RepID=K2GGK9_9BACT|nr:MAG: putative ATP-dependent RNA helicase exp9 [uncultured bacterium (gcode 4)]
MNFTEMNLKPEVLEGIKKLGYETPTKIQEEVIRESVNGKNIIGQSQTWTGKTAAFVISLLERIDLTKPDIQALILAPTRELVTQIRDEILGLSTWMYIKSLPVYGGSPIGKQIEMLRKGQTIIVWTPGRVIDLIERGALKIKEVDTFILDEVDRMLDMGFVDDIDFIWGNFTEIKQTMAFSATITPELKWMVEKYLWVDYTFIKATNELTVDKIDHSFVEIPHIEKYDALKKFIITHKSKRTIVFVQTKRDTELLAKKLYKDGFSADCLNGDMRQRERFKALKDFQEWATDIFVVTDVAARWLNVKNIELVVNYDVPSDPESYIHRIGRTGRAGAEGKAIMFVANDEKFAFKNIERRNKITIKQVDEEWIAMERKKEEPRGRFWDGGGRSSGGRFGGRSSGGRSWGGRSYGWDRDGGSRGSSRGSSRDWGFGGRSSSPRFSDDSRPSRPREDRGERQEFTPRSNDDKRASFDRNDWEFARPRTGYFANKPDTRAPREWGFNSDRGGSRGGRDGWFWGERKPFEKREGGFSWERKPYAPREGGDRFPKREWGFSSRSSEKFWEKKVYVPKWEDFGWRGKSFEKKEWGFGDKKDFAPRSRDGDDFAKKASFKKKPTDAPKRSFKK